MNKFFALLFTTLFFVSSSGQPLYESFESWPLEDNGWIVVQPPCANNWIVPSNSVAMSGLSARFCSYYYCPSGYSSFLITPELNVNPGDQLFSLWAYAGWQPNSERFRVGWSSTGTDLYNDFSWTSEYYVNDGEWTYYPFTVPIGTKYIAIHYTTYYQFYLWIDDVNGPHLYHPCADPEDLLASCISPFSVNLDWADSATAVSADIEIGPAGFTPTGTPDHENISSPFYIDSLLPNTAYDWYVRSGCNYPNYSDWSGPSTFTTIDYTDTYPYSESFESGTGKWHQAVTDDFDWTRNTSGTPSPYTGPNAAQDGSWYMYTEASSNFPDKSAGLYSCFILSGFTWPQFEFYYHMLDEYSSYMGSLDLLVTNDLSCQEWDTAWSISGNRWDKWHKASVPLNDYMGDTVIIRFNATTGSHVDNSWISDICIDNITLENQTEPVFSVVPDSNDFGNCPVNHLSVEYYSQEFVVRNIGPDTLTVSGAQITGTDAADFTITDSSTYPADLAGTDSIAIKVLFDPQTTGSKTAYLEVSTTEGRVNYSCPLNGSGFVASPQNLTGQTTITYTNELDWDPPLPEGEIRYDPNTYSSFYYLNSPSTDQDYFNTRLTAPVSGNLEYIALYVVSDAQGSYWDEILICPDDGYGQPDLLNPMHVFPHVEVNNLAGQWLLLQLPSPELLTQGTDFYIVTHWPQGSTTGPYVAASTKVNFFRCAYSGDGGGSWIQFPGSMLIRGYMTEPGRQSLSLEAGISLQSATRAKVLTVYEIEAELTHPPGKEVTVPGIWNNNGSRELLEYTVYRGVSPGTYNITFSGITDTEYIDDDPGLINGTEYYYHVNAQYTGGMQSGFTNQCALTILDLPGPSSNPVPNHLATDAQPDNRLEWDNNGNVQFIDLYLSMDEDSVLNKTNGSSKKLNNAPVTSAYLPDTMSENTWYWRIVGRDGIATETDGPVWSFDVSDTIGPEITYTPLDSTILTGARTLVDTIRDLSGIPTSGIGLPVLYWRINESGSWTSATGTSMSADQYSFTFGAGTSPGDTVFYFTVAQDLSMNNNVTVAPGTGAGGITSDPPAVVTPPGEPEFYRVLVPYSGSMTLGPGEDFQTLTGDGGLFETLNYGYLTSDIVVEITDDITEPGTYALKELRSEGGDWTVTIQPYQAERSTITIGGNVDGGLIRLDGADYIIFDGMGAMVFHNSSSSNSQVFKLVNGASHNTIKRCDISTGSKYVDNSCIYCNGVGNDSNTFSQNTMIQSYYGIYLRGTGDQRNSGNLIQGNSIGTLATNTGLKIAKYGVYARYQTNLNIAGNTIQGMYWNGSSLCGIYASLCNNMMIEENYIYEINYSGSSGGGGIGIYISPGGAYPEPGITIVNNVLRNFGGDSDGFLGIPSGILLLSSSTITGGINIWHNTIHLGPDSDYGLTGYQDPNWCAGIVIYALQGVSLLNNIIVNELGEGSFESVYSIGSAIYCGFYQQPFTEINNNLYYVTNFDSNVIGLSGDGNPPQTHDLSSWQDHTGQDDQSIVGDPHFSATLLEVLCSSSPATGEGRGIPEVTNDKNGDPRHPYFPTIGAYECEADHTGIWTGAVNTSWDNPGNWDFSPSIIPGDTNNVAVPTAPSGGNFPAILSGVNAVCKKLHVDPGADVEIQNGGTLTIGD